MSFFDWFRRRRYARPSPARRLTARLNTGRTHHMATATLNWVLPTTDVNGNPLPTSAITSVTILNNGAQFDTATGPAVTYTSPALTAGATYNFTVVVNDAAGASAPSNMASVTVPALAVPSPATNLTAVLNS